MLTNNKIGDLLFCYNFKYASDKYFNKFHLMFFYTYGENNQ